MLKQVQHDNNQSHSELVSESIVKLCVKFTDSELIGYPIRIVVGDKNLPNVEMKLRQDAEATLVPADEVAKKAADIVREELKKLNA